MFVHPSAVSLVCLPEQPTLGLSRTLGSISACVLLFLHARTHIFPTLAEKIEKFHYAVYFSPGYWTVEFELLFLEKNPSPYAAVSKKGAATNSHTSD